MEFSNFSYLMSVKPDQSTSSPWDHMEVSEANFYSVNDLMILLPTVIAQVDFN